MNKDFNIYDVDMLKECIRDLKKFNITTTKKIEHTATVFELKKILEDVHEKTRCMTIDPEYHYQFFNYYRSVTLEFKKTKKERLDSFLKFTVDDCIKQLNECIDIEYQTIDGRMIPDPKHYHQWIEPAQLELRNQYEATR